MDDNTARKQPAHLRDDLKFKKGESGNPKGRPKGSRNKLGEAFLADLYDDYMAVRKGGQNNGLETIKRVREERPEQHMKIIASLLPSAVKISGDEEGVAIQHIHGIEWVIVKPGHKNG